MLKIGITGGGYPSDNKFNLDYEAIKEDGFDCIDFGGFVNTDSYLYKMDDEAFKTHLLELKDELNRVGLRINQIHGAWPTKDSTEEEREDSLKYYVRSIEGCRLLGAKYLVAHGRLPAGWGSDNNDPEGMKKINIDYFNKLIKCAEENDVIICLENLPFIMPFCRVDGTIEIIDRINSPYFKMCYDTGHACYCKDDPYEDMIKIGERLRVLHVHDNNSWSDSHSIPYHGVFDWDKFTKGLKEIGFKGVISLETNAPTTLPKDLLVKDRRLIAEIARHIASM